MRNAAKELADLINLPPYSFVAFGMAAGRPHLKRQSAARPRLQQQVVLHHNHYHHDGYYPSLDGYEEAYCRFREAQGMSAKSWQEAVHLSGTGMDYMSGREHLREVVTERGFGLR
jgi:hypothetical protein